METVDSFSCSENPYAVGVTDCKLCWDTQTKKKAINRKVCTEKNAKYVKSVIASPEPKGVVDMIIEDNSRKRRVKRK